MANAMKIKFKGADGKLSKHIVAIPYVLISGYSALPLHGGTNGF